MSHQNYVALISVYPPPFGGVSIHTKILAEELEKRMMLALLIASGDQQDNDPSYLKRVPDIKILSKRFFWHYRIPFIKKLYSNDIKLIHCHEGFGSVPFLLFHRFIFKKQIVHTIHNQWIKERFDNLNYFSKFITKIFLKDKNTFWICVNNNAFTQMLELGVKRENISVIPAYISRTKKLTTNSIDEKIIQRIINFKEDSKLIGVYGFKFYHDINGNDVYGFDFSIDVLKKMVNINPKIKLVILIPDASDKEYKEGIISKIGEEKLTNNVLTIFDNPIINMNLFWEQLDVYFRPSTDDGDSLAIRESLACGIPVVASNVCDRPDSTIIFKLHNIENAVNELFAALLHGKKVKIDSDIYLNNLLKLYNAKTN